MIRFLDPGHVCDNLPGPDVSGRIGQKEAAVLFRTEVFSVRAKLVITSRESATFM